MTKYCDVPVKNGTNVPIVFRFQRGIRSGGVNESLFFTSGIVGKDKAAHYSGKPKGLVIYFHCQPLYKASVAPDVSRPEQLRARKFIQGLTIYMAKY